MKKLLQFLPLLILPVAITFLSFSSGSPGGRSGSPGDNGNSCVSCHSGSATIDVTDWITSDIPAGGYEPSEVYNITLTGTHPGVSKFGFEFTAEDDAGNKTGTIAILDPTETQLTNNNQAATHTSQGTTPTGDTKSWIMEWTAPDDPAGDITFYASFNAANGNGSTSGDQIYLGTFTVGEAGTGGGASDLFFSEYAEGSSFNKYVEIFNGTGGSVDLSTYKVKLGSNGNPFGNEMTLSGVLSEGDVFIISHASADQYILDEADMTNSSVINFNGDDAVGLFKDDVLIDIIGLEGDDPGSGWDVAGTTEGTKDHTLVRKPDVCDPTTDWILSAGTNADDSQWIVYGQNYWDNLGFHVSNCQGGQIVATPEFSEPGGTYTDPISVSITCATAGADIYYTTDGTDPDENSTPYLLPISISETTTLKARAYADGYDPSLIATAQYNFQEGVANIAELRAGTIGNTYLLTGEVWLTFQQDFRNQKYIQDETAGILIDDAPNGFFEPGVITTDYEIGDGIQGISGTLGEYDGMMQFVPDADPGEPVSSGNFPEPQMVTIGELFTNFEDYESELVRINDVTFADGGGTFVNGNVYPVSDPSDADGDFRTTFYDVDYIGTAIPDFAVDIIGLPNAYDNQNYITSRDLNDFILGNVVATPYFDPPGAQYENPIEVEILTDTEDAEIYFTTDGTDPDQNSNLFIDPVPISETTTLKARAYKDGFEPSLIGTAQYNFAETVATLAELRAGVIGNTYTLTGEVWLTFQQSYRNQKFVEDVTAGILIDDNDGIITSDYEIGDGITGLSGILGEYNGMLQFEPDANPGDPTSSGNFPEPQLVTISELFTNFEDYEAELVKIETATFADAGGTFSTGTAYPISDASKADGNFRTSFFDVDYIGATIPAAPTDIIGLPNAAFDENYITARSSADLIENQVPPEIVVQTPNGGETWEQTKTYDIEWLNINFTGNVNINLTRPPFTNIALAQDIPNTGSWAWTIPESILLADDYKIRVAGATPGDPFDNSDEVFSIVEELPEPDIVINEIMYNPASSLGNDSDFEYMELYNNSGFAVDISSWSISDAIEYTFDAGTVMEADAYLVIAINPDSIINHYGISNVVGPFSGGLNNSGEPVILSDANGIQMDIVTYDDGGDWPPEADGSGPSLELIDPSLDNSLAENWAASLVNDGTPGMQNSVTGAELLTVVSPNGGETFEQGSSQEVTWTYSGFTGDLRIALIDEAVQDTNDLAVDVPVEFGLWDWEIPTNLAPGENYKIIISEMNDDEPFDVSDGTFSVVEVIEPSITVTSPNGGESWAQGTTHTITWDFDFFTNDINIEVQDSTRLTIAIVDSIPVGDGFYEWVIPVDFPPSDEYYVFISGIDEGDPMDASDASFSITEPLAPAEIVINEIMYNPSGDLGNDGDFEYLELYNNDADPVDLAGWYFTEGIEYTFDTYVLNPGEYVVVAINPDSIINYYGISNVVGPFNGGLSNGGEDIELRAASGVVADYVNYDDGGDWPPEPDGDGPSLELINPDLDNNLPENWAASLVMNGTPGIQNSVFVGGEIITVIAPNGGEQWEQGTDQTIEWSYAGFDGNVNIELLTQRGREFIAENIPVSDLSYLWSIPADQTLGDDFIVKISDVDDGMPMDESDAVFSIIAPVVLPDIVINEIMYNSPGSDNEWCEIYNREDFTVDLEGFYLLDDDDFHTPVVFPAGYSIAPGQYFTISLEVLAPPLPFTPDFEGNATWSLNNSGDALRIFHSSGQLINSVVYTDSDPWPTEPGGEGPTLSLLDPMLDNSLPENWAASLQDDGTPGSENFPTEPTITVITPNGGESIQQGTTYDITWTYANYDGTVKVELLWPDRASSTLGYAPVEEMMFAWMVSEDTGENYLVKVSDSITGDPMDESDGPFSIVPPAELPDVVINEIMYNAPESGTDTLEFIELYNNGAEMVNLENWYFSQGVTYTFPNYELAAGDYVVVAYNADVMLNNFGVVALQWTSGGLSNGGEDIELRNDADEVVDYVDYDDGGAWPVAPDEYGPSLALTDPSADNTLAENWKPETVFAFDHIAGIPVYASPDAMNFSTPGQGILVSSGWTGVSTYTDLDSPLVEQNMSSVVDDMMVMQDFSQVYFPMFNINTIVNWDADKGYQLKMDLMRYLVLYGTLSADKTVDLNAGWSSLPVLSECAVEAATLFGGVVEIIFVKEMGGNKIWWPDGSLFTLDFLEPGKAYYIKTSGSVSITFPECFAKSGYEVSETSFENSSPWNDVLPTAVSHAFGIDALAMKAFNDGDMIGAFTQEGYCVGMTMVSDQNVTLMTWADDIYTEEKDGLLEDESVIFRVYDAVSGDVTDLLPEFDAGYENSGTFKTHGISYITGFKAGAAGISGVSAEAALYPNPTTGMLNITVDNTAFDQMEIYSAVGRKVFEQRVTDHHMLINLKNLENGFYFIKFVNSATREQQTVNFIKQ